MPNLSRRPLLALAVAAIAFGCATGAASSQPVPRLESASPPVERHVSTAASHRVRKHTLGERAAKIALRAVGVPYQWGGSSPSSGFDCSGLVAWAYGKVGVELPHSSYALNGEGRRVARSRMKAGDVLVFSGLGHVGMYIGRGRMVHAPHSGTLVQIVRLRGSHYGSRIVGVRRIVHS